MRILMTTEMFPQAAAENVTKMPDAKAYARNQATVHELLLVDENLDGPELRKKTPENEN